MLGSDINERPKIIFDSNHSQSQNNFFEKIKGNYFDFDCVNRVFVSCPKVTLNAADHISKHQVGYKMKRYN